MKMFSFVRKDCLKIVLQGRLDRRFSGVGTKAAELSTDIEQKRCAPGIKFAGICA